MIQNKIISLVISTLVFLSLGPKAFSLTSPTAGYKTLNGSIRPINSGAQKGSVRFSVRELRPDEQSEPFRFTVNLRLRNFDELRARVGNREHLTAAQLTADYLPLSSDYHRIVGWLKGQGLVVANEDPNRLVIDASGPVSLVSTVLQTKFVKISGATSDYTSAIQAPSLPSAIADAVVGISGLQTHLRAAHCIIPCTNQQGIANYSPLQYGYNNFYFMTPEDIRSFYNAPSNLTGTGQTVAIIMDAPVANSDLKAYNSYTGNSFTGTFSEIDVGTKPSGKNDNPDVGEANLDVEAVAGVAPGVNIRLYTIPNLSNPNFESALSRIISDVEQKIAPVSVISMSFGGPEQVVYPPSDLQAFDQLFVTASALGITCVASSGDYGYKSSYVDLTTNKLAYSTQAQYPASDPYVTGVGGTTYHTCLTQPLANNVNTVIPVASYIGETVFSAYPTTPSTDVQPASGGSVSQYFARPTWQIGNGTLLGNQTNRCVPDIAGPWGYVVNHSFSSDTGAQNATWEGMFGVMYTNIDAKTNGSQLIVSAQQGTSLAAPSFAGVVALLNQSRAGVGPIGFLNPWLYQMGNNHPWLAVNDITGSLSNVLAYDELSPVNGISSYSVYSNGNGQYALGSGYDLCVGLGTPNVAEMASALQDNVYIQATQSQTVTPGSTVVFSAFAESGNDPYTLMAPATYQWYRNGVAITDGTGTTAQLLRTGADTQSINSGDQFYCVVNLNNSQLAHPTIISSAATVTVVKTSDVGRIAGLSERAFVSTGDANMVGGFIISGSGNMPVVIRATGPTLGSYGITDPLSDPVINVYNSASAQIATNRIWGGGSVLSSAFATLNLFSWTDQYSHDSALLFANGLSSPPALPELANGLYTAGVTGYNNSTGVSLLEIYDANAAVGSTWTAGMPYLFAISGRTYVESKGDDSSVGGIALVGSTSKTFLIRANGPTLLSKFNIKDALLDPRITLYDSSGNSIATNLVWNGNPLIVSTVKALGLTSWDATSNDSAILVTLKPGSVYSANIVGAGGINDGGVALLEVYLVQ